VVKHVWNTVGSYVETGAKEAWKASQGSGKLLYEGIKGAWEDWTIQGTPFLDLPTPLSLHTNTVNGRLAGWL
jgi:hypothetical protein